MIMIYLPNKTGGPGRRITDLTGKVFGKLIVMRLAERSRSGNIQWLCSCTCGKEVAVLASNLKIKQDCGCVSFLEKTTNMQGKVFGKWTVLHHYGKSKYGDYLWWCRCACGKEKAVNINFMKNGTSTQCLDCSHSHRLYAEGIPPPLWTRLKNNAKKRGIIVDVSSDQAYNIFLDQNGLCALSGVPIVFPKTGTRFLAKDGTASLDRIDNKEGYIITNIQWVHKDINLMKNVLIQGYFIDMCKKVAQIHNK